MKIGDKVYMRDPYARYRQRNSAEPDLSGWKTLVIDSETSRSWVVNTGQYNEVKIPKAGKRLKRLRRNTLMLSEQEIIDLNWVQSERVRIVNRVRDSQNRQTLRQIEILLDNEISDRAIGAIS